MRQPDTTAADRWPLPSSGSWTRLLDAVDRTTPEFRRRLGDLFQQHWKSIYRYIRVAWKKGNEDAKDLVQGFLLKVMQEDLVGRYSKERGHFRGFLKTALDNYLRDVHRRRSALKRGGDIGLVSIEVNDEEIHRDPSLVNDKTVTPDQAFDREWAREILEMATKQVRAELAHRGKEQYLEIYEHYVTHQEEDPITYQELAKLHGGTERSISWAIDTVRRKLKETLTVLVTDYCSDPQEVYAELNQLFSI